MEILQRLYENIADCLSYDSGQPMLFSSGTFWALFLLFVPLYSLLKRNFWQMVVFVVAFDLYFYYKSSGAFVALLIITSLFDCADSTCKCKFRQ